MNRSRFRPTPSSRPRPTALSQYTILSVSALLLLTLAVPVFSVKIPPLADYINHLARMSIMAQGEANPLFAQYYQIEWTVLPNLIMDLVVPPLAHLMDIYRAGQVFVFLTLLLLATGPMAIHLALYHELSPWPLLAVPFVFNGVLMTGLMNYLFGVGVALWALASWILLQNRPPVLRGLVSLLFVLILFFCHLFAVGVYGLALLSYEIWRILAGQPLLARSRVTEMLVFLLPFLIVVPLMMLSPTLGLLWDYQWEPQGKIDGLLMIFSLYSDVVDLAVLGVVAGTILWGWKRRAFQIHPVAFVLSALSMVVFLVMPRSLFGSWMADQRLPVAVFLFLIAFCHININRRSARLVFFCMVLGVTVARSSEVTLRWNQLSRTSDDFARSFNALPSGARVLVAYADQIDSDTASNVGFTHAPCAAVIERSALVSTLFAIPGKQILSVRPAYRSMVDIEDGTPPTISQLVAHGAEDASPSASPPYWQNWSDRYDYLYVLFTDMGAPNQDVDTLHLVAEGRRFQLYRIIRGE